MFKHRPGIAMLRRTVKSIIATLTAGSLALALVVSVLAQSHTVSAAEAEAAVPCADHHAPQAADFWTETCATLCDATDFHTVLAAGHDRVPLKDQTTSLVTYAATVAVSAVSSEQSYVVAGHDPPGSALYLTTRRLRL